jgi:DNA-binding CsgD family transcriptional regulator
LFERSQVAYAQADDPLGGLALIGDLAFEWATSERAVELLGAAQAALEALDAPLAPANAFDLARDQARGRASLSAAAWAAADQRGRGLALADALALARPQKVSAASSPPTSAGNLSPREQEVEALIARGLSNREIAAALTISEKPAANHVEHIMTKLDLRSRAQVAVWAVRQGSALAALPGSSPSV